MTNFEFEPLDLKGAHLITCFSSGDFRGGFTKNFEKDIFSNAGIQFHLNETFISASAKNVIRGMHFQTKNPQAKLVSVPFGKVFDVIVDLRKASATFKEWRGFELSAANHKALYVPRGFAHGFLSQEEGTLMMYQCDGVYDKETDTGIRFDDPDIGIEWPIDDIGKTVHSERDLSLPYFRLMNADTSIFFE